MYHVYVVEVCVDIIIGYHIYIHWQASAEDIQVCHHSGVPCLVWFWQTK